MRLPIRRKRSSALGRWCVPVCALVLALCLTHQLLMALDNARHTAVMGMPPGRTLAAPIVMAMSGTPPHTGAAGGMRAPVPPPPFLGECAALQATLPLALLLLLTLSLLLGHGRPATLLATSSRPTCWVRDFLPPPLDAARRRAFLQVFLN